MLYKTCCLRNNIYIRRNTVLPPVNQPGIQCRFHPAKKCLLPFQHSIHIAQEMDIKTTSLSTEMYVKITPEGNRRVSTCRSHGSDFNTVIYIVKIAHSAYLFGQNVDDISNDRIQSLFRGPKLYNFQHIVFCRAFRHKSAFVYNNGLTPKQATSHLCK